MSFKDDVRTRLEDISRAQAVHSEKLDQNTKVLIDHHVRTTAIEARLKPVEHHIALMASITKIVITIITVTAAVASAYHYFLK